MVPLKEVYRERATGDLYSIEDGDLGRMVDTTGVGYLVLEPAYALWDKATQTLMPSGPSDPARYASLNDSRSRRLVVKQHQFTQEYAFVDEVMHYYNTPIAQLVAEYEAEGFNPWDEHRLVDDSLRYSHTMRDSKLRCLVYTMAKLLKGRL